MGILLFAGSLRKDSLNKKLLLVAEKILSHDLHQQTIVVDIKSLSIPVYDGDIEAAGFPAGVTSLGQSVESADSIVIATPEYNSSISSPLKNTIDWLSRLRPVPLEGKPIYLMGTSPGAFGAIRGLTHSRPPLEKLDAFVYPQPFALPKGGDAFDANGELKDQGTRDKLAQNLAAFLKFALALKTK